MKNIAILAIVVFSVLSFSAFIHGAVPASERAALIALYNSTNGDDWAWKNGWKTPPLHTDGFAAPGTEGSWNGVTVTGDHVTKIQMICNKLIGEIPSELGNLSYLEELCVINSIDIIEENWNHLGGEIPSELGNLGKLKMLDMSGNLLIGSIPAEFGNLCNLEELRLYGNLLSGSIPSEIGNLSNLETLSLANNKFSGLIPSSFTNLSKLETLEIGYNCLSAEDPALIAWLNSNFPGWDSGQDQCGGNSTEIRLNRSRLNFSYITSGSIPNPQTVLISNNGGVLNWEASSTTPWLSFTPTSGTGVSVLSVSVDPSGLAVGDYTGEIIIIDPYVSNTWYGVNISLHVFGQGETSAPFGTFATPKDGSSGYNSIPVTGWVLDDIGVANVKIYNGDIYIGDAVFVDGARPDVEALYPDYPNNYLAGWGYMLLTHFLPGGGNGTYTLIAKAADLEGNEVILGSKTITIDNAHSVKPFGAIDTPTQGGTASGKKFVNYGWALTPQPQSIPVDGSTIDVVLDGVVKGHPEYNIFRSDIAALFPGYANSDGAVGYYYLDTTTLSNGVHTIAWTVSDAAGNSDGIGSRYFSVMNTGTGSDSSVSCETGLFQFEELPKGFLSLGAAEELYIEIKELERLELNLPCEGVFEGYLVVGDRLRELPIGSTIDKGRGVFYWQPGPGFVGEYRFVFVGKDDHGQYTRKAIVVNIEPMYW